MAQLPGSSRVNQYTASALQTVFTYDFKIKADDEITVQKNSTTLTLTTDYTVTDAGEEAGGTVVLVTGAALNDIITLTGNSMVERETTFSNGGDFAAAAINGEYNNILDMLSENVTEIDKTVRLRVYDASFDTTIPTPTASKALKINATGDGFEMSTYDPDSAVSDAALSAAAAAASAVEASGYVDDAAAEVVLAAAQVDLAADQVDLAADQVGLAAAQVTLAEGFADDASDSADAAAASAASINLSALTASIVPNADNAIDLGSAAKFFKNVRAYSGVFASGISTAGISSSGNVAVNVNKFTVNASTGNTVIAGTLTVGGSTVGSKAALFNYNVAYNVNGGNYTTANTWQTRPLNTKVFDTISTSVTSNRVALSVGTYTVVARCSAYNTLYTAMRIYDYTASAVLGNGPFTYIGAAQGNVGCSAAFTLAVPSEIELQHMGTGAQAGTGMGYAHGTAAAGNNFYTQLLITKIA